MSHVKQNATTTQPFPENIEVKMRKQSLDENCFLLFTSLNITLT